MNVFFLLLSILIVDVSASPREVSEGLDPVTAAGLLMQGDAEGGACPADGGTASALPFLTVPPGGTESVVIDPRTHLMWEVKTDDGGPRDKDRIFSWDEAVEYCEEGLDAAGPGGTPYAGYSDWRLPTARELFGIVDYSVFQPAVSDAFHSPASGSYCQPAMYWSSTIPAADTTRACFVDFFDGYVLQDSRNFQLYVRAVRDLSSTASDDRSGKGPAAEWASGGVLPATKTAEIPVYRAAAAFDSDRERAVVFGGRGPMGATLGETWEWDGQRWENITPEDPENDGNPPPQFRHQMAYSPKDRLTYLVGKGAYPGCQCDLWGWNGNSWRLVVMGDSGKPAPPERLLATLTWDSAREALVLFGGSTAESDSMKDFWEFHDGKWHEVSPADPWPGSRYLHAAVYNPMRKKTIITGGLYQKGEEVRIQDDTWEWDGTRWHRVEASGPPPRFCSQMVWSEDRGETVLFGGWADPDGFRKAPLGDLWRWDGTTWSRIPVGDSGPGPMRAHVLVKAPGGEGFLLLGGYHGGGITDPESFNLRAWRLQLPASPSPQ